LIKACLILNARVPAALILTSGAVNHVLTASEMPLAHAGKTMPSPAPLNNNEHPHDALIRQLGLREEMI